MSAAIAESVRTSEVLVVPPVPPAPLSGALRVPPLPLNAGESAELPHADMIPSKAIE
jgi:hypothetical protein